MRNSELPDYRNVLRDALAKRSASAPGYTMSRFAKELGLSPSRLSEVFSRRQGLSLEVAKRISGVLGLQEQEAGFFCDLIEYEHARSQEKRELARIRLLKRRGDVEGQAIERDVFQMISDWYHVAILELVETRYFREDYQWIADSLGISLVEAGAAMERLIRLKMLVRDEKGRLRRWEKSYYSADKDVSEAMRNFHTQVMDRAKSAMVTRPVKESAYAAGMFPVRREDVPVVQGKIKRFLWRLSRDLESSLSSADAIYCMSMQFFEMTEPEFRK